MIDHIRIFAADIDGTLLNKGKSMGPETRAAMQRLHEEGVLVGTASGRPLDRTILAKAQEWELGFDFDFAIGMNGGDLWTKETDQFEHFYQLPAAEVKEILSFIWDLDLNALIYEDAYAHIKTKRMDDFMRDSQRRNHSYVEVTDIEGMSVNPTGKVEVHLKPGTDTVLWERIRENQKDTWIAVKTFEGPEHVTIEFLDPRVHKGIALEEYAKRKEISLDECIAFGDLDNDIGLLKTAGWGVCLLNGSDATKAAAQAITEYPVEEDGVGRYLEDHWFNR